MPDKNNPNRERYKGNGGHAASLNREKDGHSRVTPRITITELATPLWPTGQEEGLPEPILAQTRSAFRTFSPISPEPAGGTWDSESPTETNRVLFDWVHVAVVGWKYGRGHTAGVSLSSPWADVQLGKRGGDIVD
jgi:hypothetical protein